MEVGHLWISKKKFKDKNLCLKKPRTSNEGGISCSYAFLGICEAIIRGRDLIFCVELI